VNHRQIFAIPLYFLPAKRAVARTDGQSMTEALSNRQVSRE
jgi:hypothetical protein